MLQIQSYLLKRKKNYVDTSTSLIGAASFRFLRSEKEGSSKAIVVHGLGLGSDEEDSLLVEELSLGLGEECSL